MGRQADANAIVPLPVRHGVAPSYLWLDEDHAEGVLALLAARFPDVGEATWRSRIARAEVVDAAGMPLMENSPVRRGMRIWYYREIKAEPVIPFEEHVLHRDDHLLVVDKPHFLAMTPSGRFLHETLLVRLKDKLGLPQLTPIHRLDRETAGVVVFSHCAATRGAYQSLFQQRSVDKVYEALAGPMPGRSFPFTHRSRMVDGTPFFRMREAPGEPNSETLVDMIEVRAEATLYRLAPRTGRKHQLRVHMASLGAPILNDAFYPDVQPAGDDDYARPLKLLAREIAFPDPITGQQRRFASARTL